MAKDITNLAASVRQRLRNLSLEKQRDFGLVLVNYGLERLIYRLVQSRHRDQFVLKGGMLVTVWTGDDHRTTRDADFLGFGELDEERLCEIFADIMTIKGNDGLMFDVEQLTAAAIREDNVYGGVRLKTVAMLDGARIPITIDVGLGDALTQPEHVIDYPSLLGTPIPNIRAYPPETVIAEKFQAIVALGIVNGRMKDYYDLWTIPAVLDLDEASLTQAIAATFARRETAVPVDAPEGLTDAFAKDLLKVRQWRAYTDSIGIDSVPLSEVTAQIWSTLRPSCERLADRRT